MVRKRKDVSALFDLATGVASEIHQQDQIVEERSEQDRAQRITFLLSQIEPRVNDTRPLHTAHVQDLVESIAALGLIEPLVIDQRGRLLAGAHRLAAISVLKDASPEIYQQHFAGNQIPVRLMLFDADLDQERALQVELAENEKRVNYSRDQIERLAERLRALNYRDTKGRPKQGEKALGPALSVAIGVSTRYVRKVLSEQAARTEQAARIEQADRSGEPIVENRNSDPILERVKYLKKLEASLEAFLGLPEVESPSRQDISLNTAAVTLLDKVQTSLKQRRQKA
jgi:ParB family transcriptional regulator, chromosome partitioning protein